MHRRRGRLGREALRRGPANRARALRGAPDGPRIAGASPRVLCRARRREDSRRAGRHAATSAREGRCARRGHHGRGHRDELPQCRHPGDDPRDETGSARSWTRDDPEELREHGEERAPHRRQDGKPARDAQADPLVRRPQGRRPHHRGGIRRDGREGAGVQEAGRGRQARRHPRHQYLHARREPHRAGDPAPARTCSACTSSARPT